VMIQIQRPWLENLFDSFEKRLHLMDFEGDDPLCSIVCQFRSDHCRVKLPVALPSLCICLAPLVVPRPRTPQNRMRFGLRLRFSAKPFNPVASSLPGPQPDTKVSFWQGNRIENKTIRSSSVSFSVSVHQSSSIASSISSYGYPVATQLFNGCITTEKQLWYLRCRILRSSGSYSR
jgi:hypothetical protein